MNFAKKCYFQNNEDIQLFRRFQNIQKLLAATIEKSKEQYSTRISTKLMDPTKNPKACQSILKTISNNKKIPCIPPIHQNNNYITDFKEKAQFFNNVFAKQCTLVENTSKLLIPLKEQIYFFQLFRLLKMILLKSLKILI